jgi:hypothetical protein
MPVKASLRGREAGGAPSRIEDLLIALMTAILVAAFDGRRLTKLWVPRDSQLEASMPLPLSYILSDNTQCPHCVEENNRLGRGSGHADSNYGNDLWAVCRVHQVRWYMARRLFAASVPEARPGQVHALKKVQAVNRIW